MKLPCFNTETNEWEFVETRPDLTTMGKLLFFFYQ